MMMIINKTTFANNAAKVVKLFYIRKQPSDILFVICCKACKTKKEGLSSRQPQSLLNLKSNTMKNTVQKYGTFLICARDVL